MINDKEYKGYTIETDTEFGDGKYYYCSYVVEYDPMMKDHDDWYEYCTYFYETDWVFSDEWAYELCCNYIDQLE